MKTNSSVSGETFSMFLMCRAMKYDMHILASELDYAFLSTEPFVDNSNASGFLSLDHKFN